MNKNKILLFTAVLTASFITACGGKSADAYYKDGNKLMESGKYEDAVTAFEQAINKNAERAEYYIADGFAYIGLERYDEAINQFNKGYSEKDNQVVRENNKAIYRGRGIAELKAGKYEDALDTFNKALEIKEYSELNSDIKKYTALANIKLGNYKAAAELYEELLKSEKPYAELYCKLADTYAAIGEFDKAVENYELAIGLDKDNFDSYFGEYELYLNNDRKDEAMAALEKAAAIKVTDDMSGYKSGILEYLRGNYEKAEVTLGTAYDKKIYEASYYLAKIAETGGDFASAKMYFQRYEKDTGRVSLSGWYDGMAECEIREENYEGALQHVLKGLALEDISYMKSLLLKKITVYEKLNNYEEAYNASVEYLKLYPKDEKVSKESMFLKSRFKAKK